MKDVDNKISQNSINSIHIELYNEIVPLENKLDLVNLIKSDILKKFKNNKAIYNDELKPGDFLNKLSEYSSNICYNYRFLEENSGIEYKATNMTDYQFIQLN
jgi:hypothetical protein